MTPFIVSLFNSVVFVIYCYLGSHIILHKKFVETKKIMILAVVSLFASYYLILCLLDSIYAIFFSALSAFIFIKLVFKENLFMSLFISIILNTVKILFKLVILGILNNESYLILNTYKTLDLPAFYINFVAMFLSIIMILLLRKMVWKFINYISDLRNRKVVLLIAMYGNFILISFFQPPYHTLTLPALTDIIVILGVTGIGILSISGEMKMEALTKHYQEIYEYSKANAELLNDYKMQVHESKNRLLMIKGMLDDASKKEIKKYIDTILKEINNDKINTNYWLTELQYIPLPGVRSFINYKLVKLKDLGADVEVFVSNELKEIDASFLSNTEYNQLTTILGVILDNMIDSIKETEEKLVSINIYLENNEIHGEFVNSFAGKIEVDRLNEVGYTTKGKQHGVGLPLVAKILKVNKRFECTPKIIDNFFAQHIKIRIYDKSNLQKIAHN